MKSWRDVLGMLAAAIAMVLLIYVAVLSVAIAFAYRGLVTKPTKRLLSRLRAQRAA